MTDRKPVGGPAADRYDRKRVLLLGLGPFGPASLAGGFAWEPGQLVAARATPAGRSPQPAGSPGRPERSTS